MAMVNGKIVGEKAKRIKKHLKHDKPLVEKKKDLTKQAAELKAVKAKKVKEEKPKKTRVETSEPEQFRIQIGGHSFLSVDLAMNDAGSPVVEVRKWYNTQKDPEIKPGKGGFNMQASPADIKLLAAKLKAIAIELEAKG